MTLHFAALRSSLYALRTTIYCRMAPRGSAKNRNTNRRIVIDFAEKSYEGIYLPSFYPCNFWTKLWLNFGPRSNISGGN